MRTLTMKLAAAVLACGFLILVAGCGGQPAPSPMPDAPTPLSVAQWRDLPVNEKYDEATFQRLRLHDPNLNDERTWQQFMMETVIPERTKDLPDDFPRQ